MEEDPINKDEEDQCTLAHAYAQVEELHNNIKKKKQACFDRVEIPSQHMESKGSTNPSSPSAPSCITEVPPTTAPSTTPKVSSTNTGPTPANKAPGTSQQQYKYQSPMDDPTVAQKLLERLLDVQVSISMQELLSISPDMHRLVCKLVSTKQVSVGSMETMPTPTPYLWLKYEEFIIVTIRCDLWEALGVPVHPDLATTLEAANKSKEETLGIVKNMCLKISGMEFKLQIHVLCHA
ncbi:hypothetical protein ID866_10142 [Astraeus odoratus]|nr:hypothetical protein ID866_10142 [Astraeus odoratus]